MGSRKVTGTSILFVNGRREVLLFLRDKKSDIPFPNTWDVLGGHVEDNESPEDCILREMKEEIGVDIGCPDLFRRYELEDRTEYTFWLEGEFDLTKIDLHEGQRLKWFTHDEILRMSDDDIAFGFRSILLDFFCERPFDNN